MSKFTYLGLFGFTWGLLGMCALLVSAIVRLGSIAYASFEAELLVQHWLSLLAVIIFMAYSEGYKGFQRNFSPRFAARLRYLLRQGKPAHVIVAPLFCMGLFYTTRRRMIASYALILMIMGFIVGIQHVAQPWRGILDAGVVVGLAWGLITLLFYGFQAISRESFNFSPELPEYSRSNDD